MVLHLAFGVWMAIMNSLSADSDALARQFVLDQIAKGEAPSYNTLYGGGTFSDMSRHPGIVMPIQGGRGVTTAAGRYQFLESTWDSEAKKLGLADFSPASQDSAAWDLAQTTYRATTGRDLLGDAKMQNVNWGALSGQWTSLRGRTAQETQGGGGFPAVSDPSGGGSYTIEVPDGMMKEGGSPPLGADLVQQLLSKKYTFSPIDYDPFEVQKEQTAGGGD